MDLISEFLAFIIPLLSDMLEKQWKIKYLLYEDIWSSLKIIVYF